MMRGRSSFSFCLTVALALAGSAVFPDDLSRGFLHPPPSARPHTWWHWMNGNVSEAGITADLEAMKEIGLGGAQIFDIDYGIPRGPVDFNSERWRSCVKHAAYEARRLGLELVLNTASGWSCAGAPWTREEDEMKFLSFTETEVEGPCRFAARLEKPPFVGLYGNRKASGDIAVMAYPTPVPGSAAPVDRFWSKTLRCRRQEAAQFAGRFDRMSVCGGLVETNGLVDLRGRCSPDGDLDWVVPTGNWTILRLGWRSNGRHNYPSSACGRGFECDKLSSRAVIRHWAGLMDPLLKEIAPVVGKNDGGGGVTGIVIDSYEAGAQNWTQGMEKEFERRTGYSIWPWLPVFAGRVVDSPESTARFLEDFRRVVSELFVANFGQTSRKKANQYGLRLSVEPYGDDLPANSYEYARCADIPMTEFWCAPKGPAPWKSVSPPGVSEAHVWGKRIVGAEAYTTWPQDSRWTQDPWSIKRDTDFAYVQGVNRIIYHTYAHQPWTDERLVPGMTMGRFGIMFNRSLTWWKCGRSWIDYQARCQYLLQQGTAVADAFCFCGEDVPEGRISGREDLGPTADFDILTRESLLACRAQSGEIVAPGGMRCTILLLPNDYSASVEVVRKIGEIAAAGVTIIGNPPRRSFGLRGYPVSDREVLELSGRIWKRGNVYRRPAANALKQVGFRPDFIAPDKPTVHHIHRRADDGSDIYFVAQYADEAVSPACSFRVNGRTPELWNPETGEMCLADVWKSAEGRTSVKIPLSPRGSMFVVFRPQPTAGLHRHSQYREVKSVKVPGPWEVSFDLGRSQGERRTVMDGLTDWTESPDETIRYFSGTAVYRKTVECPFMKGETVWLDLGEVRNLATVRVNGYEFPTLWKRAFSLDVTKVWHGGKNQLEIQVVNTWANRLIGDELRPDDCEWTTQGWSGPHLARWPDWLTNVAARASGRTTFATWHHWSKDDVPLKSGLLGPVRLSVQTQGKGKLNQ